MMSINKSNFKTIALAIVSGACTFGSAGVNAAGTGKSVACSFRTGEANICAKTVTANLGRMTMTIVSTANANEAGKFITRRISLQRQSETGTWDVVFAKTNISSELVTYQMTGMRLGTYKIVTATESKLPGIVGVELFVSEPF